jgi:hypothetical protein
MKLPQFAILSLILVSFATYADVYKWVDEKGVTHYGNQKPAKPDVQQMNVHNVKETGSANYGQLQNVSEEEQEMVDGMAGELMKDRGNGSELNCSQAVSSALDQINTYTSQAKRNLEGQHITQANFNEVESTFRKVKSKLSASACQASSGDEREMYLCLSNDMNAAVMCFGKAEHLFN